MQNMNIRLIRLMEDVLVGLFFLLVNIRSLNFWSLYPDTGTLFGSAWQEVALWLFVLLLCAYLMIRNHLWKSFTSHVRQFPIIWLFGLYALVSITWSPHWTVTTHRSFVFVFSLFIAVYIGARYSLPEFLDLLFWLGAAIMALSLIVVVLVPFQGRDFSPYYNGAWRGIFWHKNHLGNILPIFTLVFLGKMFALGQAENFRRRWMAIILYLVSLAMIYLSKSASGYILVLILHALFAVIFFWFRIRQSLRPIHYYLALAGIGITATVVLFNLDAVLALFGRDSSFTGRIPLWKLLLTDVYSKHPVLGYGFGTTWANREFRLQIMNLLGWAYPVAIGDNGFLDILLNLGAVGFGIFLINYMSAWGYSSRLAWNARSLLDTLPFTFMVYTFFANITFSLFMEIEVFIWALVVIFWLISATQLRNP